MSITFKLTIGSIWKFFQPKPTIQKLLPILDKAAGMVSGYAGGYSGEFLSAQEFHAALVNSINKLKEGDKTQLEILQIWFLPTSCWDDFTGREGNALGNKISELLTELATKSKSR